MCARTSFLSHLMEYRPNSAPERTGPFMTCTVVDSSVRGQRSTDIGPETNSVCCVERLITKRAQRLKDDRENLKDRLHRYIELRSIQKWTPQNTRPTTCLMLDLNLLPHGHERRSCLHLSLCPKRAFFSGMYTLFYWTLNTSSIVIFVVLLISHFSLQAISMMKRAFIVE